jgi:hypothetical protein
MGIESALVWNGKSDALYREARRQIMTRNSITPKTVKEIDFPTFFVKNPNKLVYFPVFQNTTGWWGELLGTDAKIRSKIIVSPECQLYEIGRGAPTAAHRLYAAEILPKTGFFQKIRAAAITVKDMIATDSGTILTLLVCGSEDKVKNCVKLNGGEYFGTLGGY